MARGALRQLGRRATLQAGATLVGGVLGAMAGGLAGSAAARPIVPGGAWAGGSEGLETTRLVLGFIPLIDCTPLIVAKEKGYFQRHGLAVTLSREASWSALRDKVAVGALDGAHMLAAMPSALTLGVGGLTQPTVTPFVLNLNGNAITVSTALAHRMLAIDPAASAEPLAAGRALKDVMAADRKAGRPRLTFAVVFPASMHNYQLRYWMAAAGIDPDEDVRIVIVPPPRMAATLAAGKVDGFCVGEPWNSAAVESGVGQIVVTGHALWNNAPEKVFGVTEAWAQRHPRTLRALLRALIEAAAWTDRPENRLEAASIMARPGHIDAPLPVIAASLVGSYRAANGEAPRALADFQVFHRYAANFPWTSHALWVLTQMRRWNQIGPGVDLARAAAAAFRPDLYRAAAADLGIAVPTVDAKSEGSHAAPWTLTEATAPIAMGPDRFFDGAAFHPSDPAGYLASQAASQTITA